MQIYGDALTMPETAFTMTSNKYCGNCGSFDLVRTKQNWLSRRMFGVKSAMYCFGCDKQTSEADFINNALRTVPLTVDDFFFQTNLNNLRFLKYQIRPMTHVLSYCLIAAAIIGLFLIKTPASELHELPRQQIEWAVADPDATESYETQVVKSLQLEFKQLVK